MSTQTITLPGEADLPLHRLRSKSGLEIAVLPTGNVYAITHRDAEGRENRINAYPGDMLGGGVGRVLVRRLGREQDEEGVWRERDATWVQQAVGPDAARQSRFAADEIGAAWEGEVEGVRRRACAVESQPFSYRVTLRLDDEQPIWLWSVKLTNTGDRVADFDAVLVQDLGLGPAGFVGNNEAYASQYIDHTIVEDAGSEPGRAGPVILSRQNLRQATGHPWCMTGCLEGVASWVTDAAQVFGREYRDWMFSERLSKRKLPATQFVKELGDIVSPAGERLQGESACPTVVSPFRTLEPGESAAWTFFGLFEPNHPEASCEADLARMARVRAAASRAVSARSSLAGEDRADTAPLGAPPRNLFHTVFPLICLGLSDEESERFFGSRRLHEEREGKYLLSFFTPEGRHVVTASKEADVLRRHGHILLAGHVEAAEPNERVLSSTAWMHGVFASQLTLGNTNFHKLLSVSRSPLDLIPASGLRLLVRGATWGLPMDSGEPGDEWQLLCVPSVFEMSIDACRWVYRYGAERGTLVVTVKAEGGAEGGDEGGAEGGAALRVEVKSVDGEPVEWLAVMHLVMGDRETEGGGRVEIDVEKGRMVCTPGGGTLMAQRRPELRYEVVVDGEGGAGDIAAWGGDELLWGDGQRRGTGHVAIRTRAVGGFGLTIRAACGLAGGGGGGGGAKPQATGAESRGTLEVEATAGSPASALAVSLPWLAQNATVHRIAPHGLEQYGGAAWGVRDVCQGPLEHLLAVGRDDTARRIVLDVFAQQFDGRWDWPQWYMHEPYGNIRDLHAHGDVILWPLKAMCDYVEATGDFAVLREELPYREDGGELRPTARTETLMQHAVRASEAMRERCIPGTSLIRYGEGDWNDALQPADPTLRDTMTSAWTVALMYQTLGRLAEVMRRAGEGAGGGGGKAAEDGRDSSSPTTERSATNGRGFVADELEAMREAIAADVRRYLMPGGQIAGYAIFDPATGEPREHLLHPTDSRTGITASLIPMTRSILGGLFTPEEAGRHVAILRERLLSPDGARLMDRPTAYRGGLEGTFRRAESASYFGREVGLMYTHAHLRYAEAMAELGEAGPLWDALLTINPIAVTELLDHAALRQRNAYFSSSDAAFRDRYEASEQYDRVRTGDVAVEGGWRVYSSGPGILIGLVVTRLLGLRRRYDRVEFDPVMPPDLDGLSARLHLAGRAVDVRYEVQSGGRGGVRVTVGGRALEGLTPMDHPYRAAGARGVSLPLSAWLEATAGDGVHEVVVTL